MSKKDMIFLPLSHQNNGCHGRFNMFDVWIINFEPLRILRDVQRFTSAIP